MIRVLVTDDLPMMRDVLVNILTNDPDIDVVAVASDGEEAIARVKNDRPDVVVMDLDMPRMDGTEATRRIVASLPCAIVIVYDTWCKPSESEVEKARQAGAVVVLRKSTGAGRREHVRFGNELRQAVRAAANKNRDFRALETVTNDPSAAN